MHHKAFGDWTPPRPTGEITVFPVTSRAAFRALESKGGRGSEETIFANAVANFYGHLI